MKYRFGDERTEPSSRAAQIRALFVRGSTIAQHTDLCIREKVWSESELLAMATARARQEVREALGQLTDDGVPYAGPTAKRRNEAPVWKQIDLWTKADFDYNYSAYKRRQTANGQIAENIARVCVERYGEPPTYIDEVED